MYEINLEEVIAEYGGADIISFMFYVEPGERDLIILKSGIEDVYKDIYFVDAKEIDETTARAFDVKRGWLVRFIFVTDIKEANMADWISKGLDELRIKYELLEVKEVVNDV
jgi:hypothetical protein